MATEYYCLMTTARGAVAVAGPCTQRYVARLEGRQALRRAGQLSAESEAQLFTCARTLLHGKGLDEVTAMEQVRALAATRLPLADAEAAHRLAEADYDQAAQRLHVAGARLEAAQQIYEQAQRELHAVAVRAADTRETLAWSRQARLSTLAEALP